MNIYVIGGGASGIMAAVSLSKENNVTIIEKNEKIGKKLYITGKGRCNLTNASTNEEILKNIVNNSKFMMAPLNNFNSEDCMAFFEKSGVSLKVERGNRVFPLSEKSSDIIKCFEKLLRDKNVVVKYNEKVLDFKTVDDKIVKVITDRGEYIPDAVILATGGSSYPRTGSDGDGYKFAKKLNHTIIEPKAALTDIILSSAKNANNIFERLENLPKIEGLSLKNVTAKIYSISKNKILFEDFGEMLFTSNGVSGPIILSLSSQINRMNFKDLELKIDLKPALDEETLDNRILKDFAATMNKAYKNALDMLLPRSLIPFVIQLSLINEDIKINVINKKQRSDILSLLKNLTFKISGLGSLDTSIITSGGVNVKEINPKNMKSKLVDNLYFAGELIDVDALTGGFNLQVAFSTAMQIKID